MMATPKTAYSRYLVFLDVFELSNLQTVLSQEKYKQGGLTLVDPVDNMD